MKIKLIYNFLALCHQIFVAKIYNYKKGKRIILFINIEKNITVDCLFTKFNCFSWFVKSKKKNPLMQYAFSKYPPHIFFYLNNILCFELNTNHRLQIKDTQ